METALYLYTIFVMLVSAASGSLSLSAYFVSRRRSFLFAAAMLLTYFLDLALIFQYEYLGQNVEYSINQFYTIDHPQLKMLLALGTVKAHVHNILKKTGTTTRQELTQLFWKG